MIDEQLYSRQLYTIGHDAMSKLQASSILIVGLSGIGTEIAKNAMLVGFKNIAIYDGFHGKNRLAGINDLASNYYLDVSDNYVNARIDKIYEKLVSLNPYVNLEKVNTIDYNKYSIIVFTQQDFRARLSFSKSCRHHGTKFIFVNSYGLWGSIFNDFGPKHIVHDVNGEEVKIGIIQSVTGDIVETVQNHNLMTGDQITIPGSPVIYQVTYIDIKRFKVHVVNESLCPEAQFKQVKQTVIINFKPFEETLKSPEYCDTDYDYKTRDILHLINTEGDIEITDFTRCARYNMRNELPPVNSFLGGTVVQELIKACTGKYTPINQWLYYNEMSLYDYDGSNYVNNRYHDSIHCLGQEFYKNIKEAKVFVVGAGAIGCELLKNLVMIGVKNIVVTDMDIIEKSNLNRQFLFRNSDIGQYKSIVAAREVMKMNPDVKVTPHINKVGHETESIYDSKFFDSVTCVFNALDNVIAREYVDSRCVAHKKPLIESGTLGTKGNVQVIIPYLTESYGSSRDPPEQQIPICTVKNFPSEISHTIQWAREQFEYYFSDLQKAMLNQGLDNLPITELISLHSKVLYVHNNYPKTFENSVKWAFDLYHSLFRDPILQLISQFPADHVTNDGVKFWSGLKKCPTYFEFSTENVNHMNFVKYAASLWFSCFYKDIEAKVVEEFDYTEYIKTLVPKEFILDASTKISVNDEEEKKRLSDMANKIEDDPDKIKNELASIGLINCFPIEFEKDNDENNHINFITATSNMRAINYGIEPVNSYATKGIAGKIIPALATTTSMIAGLACMEFYKVLHKYKTVGEYRNTFANLALPLFCISNPIEAPTYKICGKSLTMWDTFSYSRDILLKDLIENMESKYEFEIDTVNFNSFIIFSPILSAEQLTKRLDMKITDIIESFFNKVESSTISLNFSIYSDDDNEDNLPSIILS
jgi:ubiquitin-activating enzyme E1